MWFCRNAGPGSEVERNAVSISRLNDSRAWAVGRVTGTGRAGWSAGESDELKEVEEAVKDEG